MTNHKTDITLLSDALMKLRDTDEIGLFLRDLLTNSEQVALVQRIKVAQLLSSGMPYLEIARTTGASSATIAKVSENYKYGNDGMKLVIERLNKKRPQVS